MLYIKSNVEEDSTLNWTGVSLHHKHLGIENKFLIQVFSDGGELGSTGVSRKVELHG